MEGPYIVQMDGNLFVSEDVSVRDPHRDDKEYTVLLEGISGDLPSYVYGDLVSSVVIAGKHNILQYDQCALVQTKDPFSFMAFDGIARKRHRKT